MAVRCVLCIHFTAVAVVAIIATAVAFHYMFFFDSLGAAQDFSVLLCGEAQRIARQSPKVQKHSQWHIIPMASAAADGKKERKLKYFYRIKIPNQIQS